MELFQYKQLKEPDTDLRLLKIKSVTPEGVHCSLSVISSRRKRPIVYNALSYTWGDESLKSRIIVNDKAFYVTFNLEHALRNLETSKHYWIDAICINQVDLEERNHQIQRMRDIYKSAQTVIVWLGRDHEPEDEELWFRRDIWGFERLGKGNSETTARAFNLLKDLSLVGNLIFTAQSGYSSRLIDSTLRSLETQSWAALARFFKRAWFERLWVIQELESAHKAVVQCMGFRADWHSVVFAAATILRPPQHLTSVIPHRFLPYLGAERIQNIALQGDKSNILDVLRQTKEAKCKDPRDRLYAVSGIVRGEKDFEIDYKIDVETLYFQWAWARIMRTNSLDIFSACADAGLNGRPSWIPDLRKTWGTDRALFCRIHNIPAAQQCEKLEDPIGNQSILIEMDGNNRRLIVKGIDVVDRIIKIGPVGDVTRNMDDPTNLRNGLLAAISDWEEMCISACKELYGESGPLSDDPASVTSSGAFGPFLKPERAIKFATALLRGYKKWNDEEHPASLAERFQVWRWNLPVPWNYIYTNPEIMARDKYLENFDRILFTMVHGCQMFVTSSGGFGMIGGDCHVAVGDCVYILQGGIAPYVLRPFQEPAEYTFRLMGPCYIPNHLNAANSIYHPLITLTIV